MASFQNYPLHQSHQAHQAHQAHQMSQLAYSQYHGYPPNRYQQPTNPYHHWGAANPYVRAGIAMKTESKPRLSKEEVEHLESEFQKNNKPNSSLKKGLAEQLGVDIARINNWFQNRRAKKKQMIRAAEMEASRKTGNVKSQSSEPEVKEFFHSNEQNEALLPSKATFSILDAAANSSSPTQDDRYAEPPTMDEAAEESADMSETASEAVHSEFASPSSSMSPPHADNCLDFAQTNDGSYVSSGCDFQGLLATSAPDMSTATVPCSSQASMDALTDFSSFDLMMMPGELGGMGSFQQAGEGGEEMEDEFPPTDARTEHEQDIPQPSIETGYQHASPESMTQSPPMDTQDFRFRSPPAVDLASRRRRPGPAPLGIRNASHGPVTGLGFGGRSMDPGSPLRRVTSATVYGPHGIRKMPVPPRSPFPERNQESLLRLVSSPTMTTGFNIMAPPTPDTPVVTQQAIREATVSSSSSEDEKSLLYHQSSMSSLGSVMDQNLRTPPATPSHLPDMYPYPALTFAISDDPLLTPSLHEGFPMSDMNVAPQYVTAGCGSQPPTPGYPPAGGMGFMAAFPEGAEYNWNTTQMASARASPNGQRRQLTFNNFTAEDFTSRNK